ncbi:zinc finger, SWIM-type [Methanospirillum hungatei JF-1]|uniref:Zinc finger, SWIM-type n=2 Tax=Methanospirillum hungatei TaxID=2203 RepID=Q2FPS9_METHJ|nr:zinc finger, SWIM-type [Methanospirillum hungatei JF-1]
MYRMRDPLEDLDLGAPYDDRMKKRIIQKYKGRGRRAISMVSKGVVVRETQDHYIIHDDSFDHRVIEDTCTCQDYMQTGGPCAHMIAVAIVEAMNPNFDSYDTEIEAWNAYYFEMFGRK